MKIVAILLLFLGISCYYQGIDVSTWQSYIDWPTTAQHTYFAIIRAGYGIGGYDNFFQYNYENAKANGVKVGAYWYSYASSVNDAVQEANSIIQALAGKQFEWPIYYDIEDSKLLALGKSQVSQIARNFCRTLEKNRYFCGIYASVNPGELDNDNDSMLELLQNYLDKDKKK